MRESEVIAGEWDAIRTCRSWGGSAAAPESSHYPKRWAPAAGLLGPVITGTYLVGRGGCLQATGPRRLAPRVTPAARSWHLPAPFFSSWHTYAYASSRPICPSSSPPSIAFVAPTAGYCEPDNSTLGRAATRICCRLRIRRGMLLFTVLSSVPLSILVSHRPRWLPLRRLSNPRPIHTHLPHPRRPLR